MFVEVEYADSSYSIFGNSIWVKLELLDLWVYEPSPSSSQTCILKLESASSIQALFEWVLYKKSLPSIFYVY